MAISKAQQRAVAKYDSAHYDKVLLRLPKGKRTEIQALIGNESLNSFILRAIESILPTDNNIGLSIASNIDIPTTINHTVSTDSIIDSSTTNQDSTKVQSGFISNSTTDSNIRCCPRCGKTIDSDKKKFCSANCRKRYHEKIQRLNASKLTN